MSDWQVGDLAVCVDAPMRRLDVGAVYHVTGLARGKSGCLLLVFRERRSVSETGGWKAPYFRKIRPDEHEACEPEFITLLKRTKHKVQA